MVSLDRAQVGREVAARAGDGIDQEVAQFVGRGEFAGFEFAQVCRRPMLSSRWARDLAGCDVLRGAFRFRVVMVVLRNRRSGNAQN